MRQYISVSVDEYLLNTHASLVRHGYHVDNALSALTISPMLKVKSLSPPQFRDFPQIHGLQGQLESHVEGLELLVMDLLDVTRIQQGRLELRPKCVNLTELTQRIVEEFSEISLVTAEHSPVFEGAETVHYKSRFKRPEIFA